MAAERKRIEEGLCQLRARGGRLALVTDLRDELKAVERTDARIAAGTYGRSVDSGAQNGDERLEAR